MIINTNTWHYKLYDFTYTLSRSNTPRQTNLCQYMRRFLLLPIAGIATVCLLLLMVCIVAGSFLIGPVFGYLPPTWHPTKFFDDNMRPYQGLKLGKSYNAYQLYPWHGILLLLILGGHFLIYRYNGVHPLVVEAEWIGGIMAVVSALIGLIAYFSSDTGKVLNEYLAAKKQKVCPVVEFNHTKE